VSVPMEAPFFEAEGWPGVHRVLPFLTSPANTTLFQAPLSRASTAKGVRPPTQIRLEVVQFDHPTLAL
ncbi:MAG: hypothetical protein AAF199_02370, partial [Pseudomonadota bacterium]